ncbi:MAG: helix-turn-helix domain-containing protein [Nitrospiraceae bacterium]
MKGTYDVEGTAERLGVSPHTVRAWIRQGRLPYYKLGRRLVVGAEDVEAFLSAHRIEADEEASQSG